MHLGQVTPFLVLLVVPLLPSRSARAERPQATRPGTNQSGADETPRGQKQLALERLRLVREEIALGADGVGERDEALAKLDHSIEELVESLEPTLWLRDEKGQIDGLRLDPEEGAHVFHEERHAAQYAFDAIRNGEIEAAELRSEILAVVEELVAIDRRLAEVALGDAINAGGEREELEESEAELARGDALVEQASLESSLQRKAALLYEAVDNAYRHSWEAAIDALEDGFVPLTGGRHSTCGHGRCGGSRWEHRGGTRQL